MDSEKGTSVSIKKSFESHISGKNDHKNQQVEKFHQTAMQLLTEGKVNEALKNWQSALKLDACHFESLANTGYVLFQLKDFESALNYLEEAHKIIPERDDVTLQIAQLRGEKGDFHGGKKILEPLINSKNVSPNAFLLFSKFLVLEKDFEGAKQQLERLLELNPNLPEALINLAILFEEQSEIKEASIYFHRAVENAPFHFLAHEELGRFLNKCGKSREALPLLQKAIQLNPSNWSAYVHLGNTYNELGEFEKAIESYKKALNINPLDLGTQKNISRIMSRFVPPWHLKMLADHERNDAYEAALKKAVGKDTVVFDIGTGSGLLSLMAAKYGAQKVFTCEQSKFIAQAALDNIKKNGFENKITLFQSQSNQLKNDDFEKAPNIIVAEIFDSGLLGEHAIPSFRHAMEKLCDSNCKVIPKKAEIKGRLLHSDSLFSVNPVQKISGFDLAAFDQFRVPEEYITHHLQETNHEFCSETFKILDVNFEQIWPALAINQCRRFTIIIDVTSSKSIHGIAFWFTLFLDEEITLSSAPGRKNNHWGQALFFLNTPIKTQVGKQLSLTVAYTDTSIWFEDPHII